MILPFFSTEHCIEGLVLLNEAFALAPDGNLPLSARSIILDLSALSCEHSEISYHQENAGNSEVQIIYQHLLVQNF